MTLSNMNLVINNEQVVPAGGSYIAKCDHCGAVFKKHYVDGVASQFNEHLRANGLPEKTRTEVVQVICRDTPDNICQGEGYQYKERAIGWQDIVNGTRVLATWKLSGSPMVSPQVAAERAAICAVCPENVRWQQSCSTCQHVEDAVKAVVGDHKTPFDDRLLACFVCGCSNKAQIHFTAEVLAKGVNDSMMERFSTVKGCWKAKALSEL